MKRHLRTNDHTWNLYATAVAKTISTLQNEKGEVKGVALVIINTGGAAAFQEMLCDISFAPNRLHRLKMGKILCHEEACPKGDDDDSQASRTLASEVQIGRLLIKQEMKLSQERSIITQNAAFSAARNITSNHEQKIIMKDWKGKEKEGSNTRKKQVWRNPEKCSKHGRPKTGRHSRRNEERGAKVAKKPVGSQSEGRKERQTETPEEKRKSVGNQQYDSHA